MPEQQVFDLSLVKVGKSPGGPKASEDLEKRSDRANYDSEEGAQSVGTPKSQRFFLKSKI